MLSELKDLFGLSKSGWLDTFRVTDKCVCRALIQEDGEILSNLDCWNTIDEPHQSYFPSNQQIRGIPHLRYSMFSSDKRTLEERVAQYADHPKMKRFEVKI